MSEIDKLKSMWKWTPIVVFTSILLFIIWIMYCLMQKEVDQKNIFLSFLVLVPFLIVMKITAKVWAPKIATWIGDKVAQQCVYPGNNVREAPPEYAAIRAKITNGDLDEAIEELKVLLIENPLNSHAVSLMADILIDEKEDYKNAIGLLANYINKAPVRDENLASIMRLTDIYVDNNCADRAMEFLERELKKSYSSKIKDNITKRLSGIS